VKELVERYDPSLKEKGRMTYMNEDQREEISGTNENRASNEED